MTSLNVGTPDELPRNPTFTDAPGGMVVFHAAGRIVTVEEGSLAGGFGSAVLEHLEDTFTDGAAPRARVVRVGIPDRYVTHGKPALLREEAGLTGQAVAERTLNALRSRQRA